VVAQCYVEGVSTRRVDDIARAMGIEHQPADTDGRQFEFLVLEGHAIAYLSSSSWPSRAHAGCATD
jgi:hypothetical protein